LSHLCFWLQSNSFNSISITSQTKKEKKKRKSSQKKGTREGWREEGGAMANFGHSGGGTSVGPKTASASRNQPAAVTSRSNHSKTLLQLLQPTIHRHFKIPKIIKRLRLEPNSPKSLWLSTLHRQRQHQNVCHTKQRTRLQNDKSQRSHDV
jgi:hypothetical protein